MIPISTYQEFCKIPTGSTIGTYNEQLSKLLNLNIDKLTDKEISEKVANWIKELTTSELEHKYIRMNGKWYKIDLDIYNMVFSQWIYLNNVMKGLSDVNTNEVIHKLVSLFLKPCRFYKWFPKKFSDRKVDSISSIAQKQMDIRVALQITNKVFFYIIGFSRNTQIDYLEELGKMLSDKVKD